MACWDWRTRALSASSLWLANYGRINLPPFIVNNCQYSHCQGRALRIPLPNTLAFSDLLLCKPCADKHIYWEVILAPAMSWPAVSISHISSISASSGILSGPPSVMDIEGESLSFEDVALARFPCPGGWPHTRVHKESTNGIKMFLITQKGTHTVGRDLRWVELEGVWGYWW